MFGRAASYRFVDIPSDGRYNLALSQSQLDSAYLYEKWVHFHLQLWHSPDFYVFLTSSSWVERRKSYSVCLEVNFHRFFISLINSNLFVWNLISFPLWVEAQHAPILSPPPTGPLGWGPLLHQRTNTQTLARARGKQIYTWMAFVSGKFVGFDKQGYG